MSIKVTTIFLNKRKKCINEERKELVGLSVGDTARFGCTCTVNKVSDRYSVNLPRSYETFELHANGTATHLLCTSCDANKESQVITWRSMEVDKECRSHFRSKKIPREVSELILSYV